MFNSGILDVAIGIVFVYLLVSLIVSAANELVAALCKMRGRNLWLGLSYLLPAEIAKKVYKHPLIVGLSASNRPSYIPSRTFALALLDVVCGESGRIHQLKSLQAKIGELKDPSLKRPLYLLLDEAKGDIDRFKINMEVWFNDAMDRVSGVYKRKVHYALFGLGLIFAVVLNVDTIVLANRLSHDSALRAALVSSAEAAAKGPPPAGSTFSERETTLAGTIQQLDKLSLPIGWRGPGDDLTLPFARLGLSAGFWDVLQRHFVGWIITAFAATLGAPFWFDLLNRFVNIRSAGKAPEEKPKDPKEVPKPDEPGEHTATSGRAK